MTRFVCSDFLIYCLFPMPAGAKQKQASSRRNKRPYLKMSFLFLFKAMFLGYFWFSPHAAFFVPFCRLHALGRTCTLPSRRLCLPQGLHFLRKEFWLESRWVLKIKAEKGPTQRNSVVFALFSFLWLYGLNLFLCVSSWSAVRQRGTNTMERFLLDSIRLVWWVFPLSPDSFYWELQKFAVGNPQGLLQAEAWDQRALRHVSGGTKAVDGQFRETIRTQSSLCAPSQMGALAMLLYIWTPFICAVPLALFKPVPLQPSQMGRQFPCCKIGSAKLSPWRQKFHSSRVVASMTVQKSWCCWGWLLLWAGYWCYAVGLWGFPRYGTVTSLSSLESRWECTSVLCDEGLKDISLSPKLRQ